jgi:hypothetical protein
MTLKGGSEWYMLALMNSILFLSSGESYISRKYKMSTFAGSRLILFFAQSFTWR